MKNLFLIVPLCSALFACQSGGDHATTNDTQNAQATIEAEKNPDAEFAMKAAEGGLLEVQLGQLALTKATSQQVRDFAQQMIDDHGRANDELKALAQTKNIVLPTTLGEEKQKMYDELAQESAEDFDKEYAEMMVEDHKEDIDLFEKEAENGKDAELKNWASGKVATLKHHLEMAEQTQSAQAKNN